MNIGGSSCDYGLNTPTRSSPSTPTFSPKNSVVPFTPPLSKSPNSLYSWNWSEKPFCTPDRLSSKTLVSNSDSGKRGRPRADVISHLILEGSSSPSGIKCRVCSRVFPREKSLQAHLRTHTGERPYNCDYPGCTRAFTQSGQLKTHQRLHAGEKPFICSSPGCNNRYTHANRTCPTHPYHKPKRSTDLVLQPVNNSSSSFTEDAVTMWLNNYRRDRQDKTPGKLLKCEPIENENGGLDQENDENSPRKYSILQERLSSPRKTLCELSKNITRLERGGEQTTPNNKGQASPSSSSSSSNLTTFKLKKRWLREAFQDEVEKRRQRRPLENSEDLALPIRWSEEESRRSPKSLELASALVELAGVSEIQPLNLSLTSSRRSGS